MTPQNVTGTENDWGGYNVWCILFDKRQDLSWKLLYEKDETMPVNIWRKTQLQVIFKNNSPKKWPVWCASGLEKKSLYWEINEQRKE